MDEQEQENEQEAAAASSSRLPLIMASVIGLLLGGGIGYGVAQYLGDGSGASIVVVEEDPDAIPTQTVELGEFTVNLRNTAGGRILQMNISALVTEAGAETFETHHDQMRDAVLVMASDKTVADLDGGDNKIEFRNEVMSRLNTVLGSEVVRAVYLTRFVVQ